MLIDRLRNSQRISVTVLK
uniref:Uncharacterized protein n=1 Tax=Anguilla anguilla TaxID=7936 RepID=A0A0E9VJ78_ANGAN